MYPPSGPSVHAREVAPRDSWLSSQAMVIRPCRVRYLTDPDGASYTEHVVYCAGIHRRISGPAES